MSALADVEQHQHRLLGQEAEAADALRLVLGQLHVADRPALAQRREEPLQHHQLALVRLALGRRAVAARRPQLLDAPLDHAQVGEHELQLQPLDVAPGVDGAVGMRHGRVVERPHHVEQRVGVAQAGQLVGRDVAPGSRPSAEVGGAGRST